MHEIANARANEIKTDDETGELIVMDEDNDDHTFVQRLIATKPSSELLGNKIITFLVGGFQITGNLLTWAVFYILSNNLQDKVLEAVRQVLKSGETVPKQDQAIKLNKGYLGQVINESLRLSVLAPWAARESDNEIVLESGAVIPPKTPIVQPLGQALLEPSPCGEITSKILCPNALLVMYRRLLHPLGFVADAFVPVSILPASRRPQFWQRCL